MGGQACALIILDDLIGERVGPVHHRHHDRWDGLAPGQPRCAKAPLADADDMKAVAIFRGDDDRLQHAARSDRGRKVIELLLVEHAAWNYGVDRKSTRLNSSPFFALHMPTSA